MQRISDLLLAWYALEGRDLPWRRTKDAYRIWLSEVILQQTRVAQGMAYYARFEERFPTIDRLAAASEDEVLKLWQGLGYYSRARNLHAAAQQVVAQFAGVFPTTLEAVRSLRGVGEYTAAAICSAAYDAPCAVVDGNVYRVLTRLYDVATPIDTAVGKTLIAQLAQEELPAAQAAAYNQAIMDFGALVCTPRAPRCATCPLAERCQALAAVTVADRPVKQGRTKVRDRWFSYLHITSGCSTLLRRRGAGDIWQGLWELPLIETSTETDFAQLCRTDAFRAWVGEEGWHLVKTTVQPPHQLSHQRIHATFYCIEIPAFVADKEVIAVQNEALDDYAVSRLTELYLIQHVK